MAKRRDDEGNRAPLVSGQELSLSNEDALLNNLYSVTDADTEADFDTPLDSRHGEQLAPGTIIGRYVIQNEIGRGGMGVVYLAFDTKLDRRVALKLLDVSSRDNDKAYKRLLREAHALAKLNHPNVIRIYDVGSLEKSLFLAMEYAPGLSLRAWVKKTQPDWRKILEVMLMAGKGLHAAHGVGIMHRDFKPDNVTVSDDGRVWVLDFGLARAVMEGETINTPSPDSVDYLSESSDEPITKEGSLMGTRGYLAPEQYLNEKIDERTDQFAYCVTLFELLYAHRPFSGRTHHELKENTLAGRVKPPAKSSKVPAPILDVIIKGMAPSPEDRYPSMRQLLEALEKKPRHLNYLVSLIILTFLGIAIAFIALRSKSTGPPCLAPEKNLQGVWDHGIKDKMLASFLASGHRNARTTYVLTEKMLDDYLHKWIDVAREACVETYVTHRQPESVFDKRTICLQQKLGEVKALTRVFTKDIGSARDDVIDRSVQAVSSLPSVDTCSDLDLLEASITLPPIEIRKQVSLLNDELDDAKAMLRTGQYREGMEISKRVVDASRELGYHPLLAHALQIHGWLESRAGKNDIAKKNISEAAVLAAEVDDVDLLARSTMQLVYVEGNIEAKLKRALIAEPFVGALIARAGDDPISRSRFLCDSGLMLLRTGHLKKALKNFKKAQGVLEKSVGLKHPELAHALNLVGNALVEMQDFLGAKKVLERALDIWRETLGPYHPRVAIVYNNLGDIATNLGNLDEAADYFQRALAIYKDSLSADHPKVGIALVNLAEVFRKKGDYSRAVKHFERAAKIFKDSYGDDHPLLAYALQGEGSCLLRLGKAGESIQLLESALAIRRDGRVSSKLRAKTMFTLAKALWDLGSQRRRARSLAEEAETLLGKSGLRKKEQEVSSWLKSLHSHRVHNLPPL